MLNITTRISLSRRSKRLIKVLRAKQNGILSQSSWGMIANTVKNELSKKLLFNQGLKCVYCERYLIGLTHQIDHFAHKGNYGEFTFTTVNLFYACGLCNSSGRKGQKNTILNPMPQYHQCIFSIVHPYFHTPANEILFSDPDQVYFDRLNCTPIGIATIDFFGWDDYLYTTIRARTLISERLNPLASIDELKLIQEAISYKYS